MSAMSSNPCFLKASVYYSGGCSIADEQRRSRLCTAGGGRRKPGLRAKIYEPAEDHTWTGRLHVSPPLADWRGFRARLCAAAPADVAGARRHSPPAPWAHEISAPEEGCVLVATEQLDRHPLLARSAVLLLKDEQRDDPRGGASLVGVIMNKKLHFDLAELDAVDAGISLGLPACPSFLGGPISSASSFHIITSEGVRGLRSVLPGLRVGADQAALLSTWDGVRRGRLSVEKVRVHIGQLEWASKSLEAEVRLFQWWKVVSCSTDLLLQENVDRMWDHLHSLLPSLHV